MTTDRLSDSELIIAAVAASGLAARSFAEYIIGRDERTVRRWTNGHNPMPPQARSWLEHWLTLSDRRRAQIVRALMPSELRG